MRFSEGTRCISIVARECGGMSFHQLTYSGAYLVSVFENHGGCNLFDGPVLLDEKAQRQNWRRR